MNLKEKLETINKPKIKPLASGSSDSIDELYNNVIKEFMPKANTIKQWHKLLMRLINDDDCVYVVRAFHSEKKANYSRLRRGFLSSINNGIKFIYVDNYFISIIKKLQLDNYVPNYDELVDMIKNRSFPIAYFHTSVEKEKAAYVAGKNPGIDTSHYKIAHIIPTGERYNINDKNYGLAKICKLYFPRGESQDWEKNADGYYIRNLVNDDYDLIRKILSASLLRCIHPLNTFLVPGTNHEIDNLTNKQGVGEHPDLVRYMYDVYSREYPVIYDEFVEKAMVMKKYYSAKIDHNLKIEYGPNINCKSSIPLTNEQINNLLDDYLVNGLSLVALDEKYFNKPNSHGTKSYNLLTGNGIMKACKGSIKKGTFEQIYNNATGAELTMLTNYLKYKKML